MMQLVSSHGIVLLEREKPRPASSKNATLYVRHMSQGMKKAITTRLMSREEFFTKVVEPTHARQKATPTNNADI